MNSLSTKASRLALLSMLLPSAAAPLAVAGEAQSSEHLAVQVPYAMGYLCYLPDGYAEHADQRWPLVIFLHGTAARGTQLAAVKQEGLARLIEQGRKFPFIVVSPQCPEDEWWNLPAVEAFIDEVGRRYRVDADRVILTGISMGGFGVWALAQRDPGRYAAIIPIAGSGETKWAPRLRDLPVWAAHGAKDTSVPIAGEQALVDAIKAAGGVPHFTVYPVGEHNVWDKFYADEDLSTWILAQNRQGRSPAPSRLP